MSLISLLRSIKARDPAARSLYEVAFLYPGVRALFVRIAGWFRGDTSRPVV